jgi:predicted transcriptional regulator
LVEQIPAEVMASISRLTIADLISKRPRTLKELSDKTGVSMQAVLKHLDKLDGLGLLEKRSVTGSEISARKLYSMKGLYVEDFSTGDLTIVNFSKEGAEPQASKSTVKDLETLAVDNIILRRQIREKARRLQRSIGRLVENEEKLKRTIEGLELNDEERLILQTAYTEETLDEAEKALRATHDIPDPRRSIDRAKSKVVRNVKRR